MRDVDADGDMEIVVGGEDNATGLYVEIYDLNAQKELVRIWENLSPVLGVPATSVDTADIDGDGVIEIIVGTDSGTNTESMIVVFDQATGLEEWRLELPNNSERIYRDFTIADVDGDGALELLASLGKDEFRIMDAATGAVEWMIVEDCNSIDVVDDGGLFPLLRFGGNDGYIYEYRFDGLTYQGGFAVQIGNLSSVDDLGHVQIGSRTLFWGSTQNRLDIFMNGYQNLVWTSSNYGDLYFGDDATIHVPSRTIFVGSDHGCFAFRP